MLVPSALRRPRRLPWFVSWFVSWFASWLVLWLGRRAGDLVHEGNRLADQLFDRGDGLGVVRSGDDGDRGAGAAGAAGAADAVHVVVGMDRHIEIIDVADVGNIEAAGSDVGGDQQRDFVLAELLERGRARRLIHVAVQRLHRKAVAQQRAMQRGDVAFAIAEDDGVLHALGGANQAAQRVALLGAVAAGPGQELGCGGDGGGRSGDFDAHRIAEKLLGDAPDFRRHGGGEEQRLAGERYELADALDVGDETHVQHAIGLVDDEELDAAEQKPSALVMVEQAAGRRDQNIDAAHQLGVLVVERDAADDQRDVELIVVDAVFDEALFDLRRELAGRLQNQRARHARSRSTGFQHGQHRQHECRGLAGAGLGDAQHVAPGEHVGDGLILDGGRSFVTSRRNGSEYFFGQAEM